MQFRKSQKQKTHLRQPSVPLTRTLIPPLQPQFGSMPSWLYSAIVGNGHLLICLDETGAIAQLFYPYIDAGPNVRSFLLGIQVVEPVQTDNTRTRTNPITGRGSVTRIAEKEAQQDNVIYWLAGEGWVHELAYLDGSATVSIIATNAAIGLRVEQRIAVHTDRDVCTIEIKLTNLKATAIDCKLVTYAGLDIDHRMSGNTCFFDSETSLLTFFAYDRYISILCDAPVDGFTSNKTSIDELDYTFKEISVGEFDHREYALGQVSGAVRHDFGRVEAGANTVRHMNLCFGRSLEEVVALSKSLATKSSDIEDVTAWWQNQYADILSGLHSPIIKNVYNRSLITLRLLTDGTGGIVAAPECDPDFRSCGGYGPCWPRDGAFIAHALDTAGQHDHARMFYDWALRVQSESGVWYQRYHVNGQLASTWGLVQFDEVGAVVWAICRHIQLTGDISYGRKVFPQLVRACLYMQEHLDPETGLAPMTKELWEERDCISTYACASTWAGFHTLSDIASKLGETAESKHWASAASQLKAAIETHLWDASQERFLRGIKTRISSDDLELLRKKPRFSTKDILEAEFDKKLHYFRRLDSTIDVSILGLSVPFGVFAPDDRRILATADSINTHLTSPVGGIQRYEDDHYRGGNPWVICTLWLALQDLASSERERPLRLYNWVLEHRTRLNLLPEQVDRTTGKPCWVIPLGWSHAMFILATQALKHHGLLPE